MKADDSLYRAGNRTAIERSRPNRYCGRRVAERPLDHHRRQKLHYLGLRALLLTSSCGRASTYERGICDGLDPSPSAETDGFDSFLGGRRFVLPRGLRAADKMVWRFNQTRAASCRILASISSSRRPSGSLKTMVASEAASALETPPFPSASSVGLLEAGSKVAPGGHDGSIGGLTLAPALVARSRARILTRRSSSGRCVRSSR